MDSETRSFGDWLREQLERRGMSSADLARATGKDTGQVSNWMKGHREPKPPSLRLIAKALDLHLDVVLDAAGVRELDQPPMMYEVDRLVRQQKEELSAVQRQLREQITGRRVAVRFRGRVPADAVRWVLAEEAQEMRDVPEIDLGGRPPERVFAVQVSGDCLVRRGVVDGDMLLCERLAPGQEPKNGQLALVGFSGEYTLKYWYRSGDWIELRDGDDEVIHRFSVAAEYVVEGLAFHRMGRSFD